MEELTNQSEQQVTETIEQPIEAAPQSSEITPVTTQEEPKGIRVKYNKEERFVPEEELPTWVQKGLNYDKVSERAKEAEAYQQKLERVAKFYGYENHDAYMEALEQAEQNQIIKREADRLGVPEEYIRQELMPLKSKLSELEQEKQRFQQEQERIRVQEENNRKWGEFFKTYPDAAKSLDGWKDGMPMPKWHNDAFQSLLERGYDPLHAYELTNKEAVRVRIEQEALQKLEHNASTTPGALGHDAPEERTGYLAMTPAERKAFRERVKNGEIKP